MSEAEAMATCNIGLAVPLIIVVYAFLQVRV